MCTVCVDALVCAGVCVCLSTEDDRSACNGKILFSKFIGQHALV